MPRPRHRTGSAITNSPGNCDRDRDCSYAAYDGSRSDHSRNRRYRHCVRNNTAACAELSAKDYDVSIEYDVSIKVEGPENVESTVIESRVSGEDIHVTQLESTRTENWANWARSEQLFVDGAVFLRPLGGQWTKSNADSGFYQSIEKILFYGGPDFLEPGRIRETPQKAQPRSGILSSSFASSTLFPAKRLSPKSNIIMNYGSMPIQGV